MYNLRYFGLMAVCVPMLGACSMFEGERAPALQPQVVYSSSQSNDGNVDLAVVETVDVEPEILMAPSIETPDSAVWNVPKTKSPTPYYKTADITQFSNANVTVFALSGDAKSMNSNGARDRKKTDYNGGYVVYDEGVTVYSVDGPNHRPDYMANYAVPMYGEEMINPKHALMPMPETIVIEQTATPVALRAIAPAPMRQTEPKKQIIIDKNPGRRSEPLLTSYE